MIIDVHHHYVCERGYLDGLLHEMDALGIDKAGLMAMGPLFERLFVTTGETCGPLSEEDVEKAVRAHPDRFFGYVYVRLGVDGADKVRRWGDRGFPGVKFHIPKERYDHDAYFPVYEEARKRGMVCLFHTGLFFLPKMVGERVSSERTRPVHVEAVVNEMPDLKVILAHMGGVWAEEACGMMRMHENVHADLSGRLDGWRKAKPIAWFNELLFWPGAADKVLFGSDVHHREMGPTLEDHLRILRAMGWDAARERKLLAENAEKLFRFK